MANFVATSYKIPKQLDDLLTYIETVDDTYALDLKNATTREPTQTIVIVTHKAS